MAADVALLEKKAKKHTYPTLSPTLALALTLPLTLTLTLTLPLTLPLPLTLTLTLTKVGDVSAGAPRGLAPKTRGRRRDFFP